MARMPGTAWKPITVNFTPGGQVEVRGVVLHIMAGTLGGTDSWFRNPRAQASSHFGTSRGGQLVQWVDTRDKAWTQGTGNRSWISIENEGKGGDELTDAQLDRCAQVLAWAHTEHGVPLQVTSDPGGRGLGHHSMGGKAWGGHSMCPGARIIAQKPEIVRRAKAIVNDAVDGGGPTPWPGRLLRYIAEQPLMRGQDVRTWQTALRKHDGKTVVDNSFGPKTRTATRAFQRSVGLVDDGIVGPAAWRAGVQ
ncbi:N-acetylmuramoyl-L-alanine amidase [Streptosporangium sp. NBC_01755]|uniref:peptidoglycan recognition protein family protein n=1 Tax=Streptosporangium sp. NBC_01755 TaxID=2975949 RepID=UPI002DDAE3D4|nr:N-acetylmuramoyl-L-alanine amidase [Streptosporangium sp. NBC_01755]WSC98389.1 N-acetylmuramoyl-L-alanine amidase [Streptosporangium sp. NBC_01755]